MEPPPTTLPLARHCERRVVSGNFGNGLTTNAQAEASHPLRSARKPRTLVKASGDSARPHKTRSRTAGATQALSHLADTDLCLPAAANHEKLAANSVPPTCGAGRPETPGESSRSSSIQPSHNKAPIWSDELDVSSLVIMRSLLVMGYTDPRFPPPGNGDTPIIIYGYTPALSLAVVGVVSFGICSVVLAALLVKLRWNWVAFLTLVGALFEVVGYIARALSANVDPYRLTFFVIQYFFIVCAPVFFSAAIYLAFCGLLKLVAGTTPPVRPRALFLTFLAFDIVTTVVQIAGAASIGVAESNGRDPNPANDVLIAGLAVQVASFLVFLVIFAVCAARLARRPAKPEAAPSPPLVRRAWLLLGALLLLGLLVELRTVFRLAEAAPGVMSSLSSNERLFAGLEYVPIILVVAGLVWLSWELAALQRRAAAEAAPPAAAV